MSEPINICRDLAMALPGCPDRDLEPDMCSPDLGPALLGPALLGLSVMSFAIGVALVFDSDAHVRVSVLGGPR